MKKNPMWKWLESSWQSDVTIPAMKPWLTILNKEAIETKNMKLYHIGQSLTKIMKECIAYLKENKKILTNYGFASFEEWACEEGFFTTFGQLQAMDWAEDSSEILFNHYSDAIQELAKRRAEQEETEEMECLSSANMKTTCTSSTIVHTPDQRAGASTANDCVNMLPMTHKTKQKGGKIVNRTLFQKEKSPLRKRKISSDDGEDVYQPGTLFQDSQASVEDESEPDVDIQPLKKQKKVTFKKTMPKELMSDEDENMDTEEGYASMLANLARAHSLVQSTGKISQTISLKDDDGYINITSPGERGSMVMKLELYPFKDSVKLQKNQYWTKRNFSCKF